MGNRRIKVCLTCSAGGHLRELIKALNDIQLGDCYWVTYRSAPLKKFLGNREYYFVLNTSPNNRLTWIVNGVQSFFILLKNRPHLIVSTGAGVSFPTIWLGKKIFKCRIIYIASAADVYSPSRTTKRAYPLSDLFLIQWPEMLRIFPKAIYIGVL